jgi:hydroxymethylpyrimidine pyrophosphatase-like HAD family hydrolase
MMSDSGPANFKEYRRVQPIALVDLDDTLFQTKRKVPHLSDDELVLASVATNGSHSYMTKRQEAFASWLLEATQAIPVTARSSEALSRVTIPFNSYAIVSNGAAILDPDGKIDAEWEAIVSEQLRPIDKYLDELMAAGNLAAEKLGVSIRSWKVMEGDLATYVVFKENEGHGSRLQKIAPIVEKEGWVRHHNGNNLALIPPVISKRLASEFLVKRLRLSEPHRPVIGYGDSVSDFSYLALCDWWGAPGTSQISDLVVKEATK